MKKIWIVLAALCLLMTAVMGVVSVSAAESVVYGDINGDGNVNNRDLGLLQRHLNGLGGNVDLEAADVNHDDKVNNRDLGLLQRFLNGLEDSLDPEQPDVPGDDNIFNDTELDWT